MRSRVELRRRLLRIAEPMGDGGAAETSKTREAANVPSRTSEVRSARPTDPDITVCVAMSELCWIRWRVPISSSRRPCSTWCP